MTRSLHVLCLLPLLVFSCHPNKPSRGRGPKGPGGTDGPDTKDCPQLPFFTQTECDALGAESGAPPGGITCAAPTGKATLTCPTDADLAYFKEVNGKHEVGGKVEEVTCDEATKEWMVTAGGKKSTLMEMENTVQGKVSFTCGK